MSGLIVHEWLEPHGGSERVVDALRQIYPDAELLALWNDAPWKYQGVQESWLARSPLRHHKSWALPFMPYVWRHVIDHAKSYDWVLVSSHLFAHHVAAHTPSGDMTPKFVYAHTPARYIWEPDLDKRGKSPAIRVASALLKPIDCRRAQEPVAIAANSKFVQERIRRAWHRDASVIYPPVDVELIQGVQDWRTKLAERELDQIESLPDDFILGASRFVPYKRLDWVIRAGSAAGIPVVIAGGGPQEPDLRALAEQIDVPVTFIIDPSTPMLYSLYQAAMLFVFPAIEDFGIMPVEAQAAGTAVVTTSVGGSTESHVDGLTGTTAESDDLGAVERAVIQTLGQSFQFDPTGLSEQFGLGRFHREIHDWMSGVK